jgi:hypothetical protein
MKGYVDGQDTVISNSVTGANAAIVTANTNMKGYVDGQDTVISNSVTGANAAIVTANTNIKGYTDAAITTVTNSVTGANAAIVTANTNMKGYVDGQITTVSSSVTGANAAIVTANTALKGYVDAANTIQTNQITTVSSSVTGANAAIVTANTNLKGYVDANNATQLTSINNITNGSVGFANIIPTTDTTYTLGSESYRWNTAHADTISATRINLPLSASLFSATINSIDYAILLGNQGGAALVAPSANVNILNDISLTSTYANVTIHNANTAVTHTWQFTQTGNLTLPTNGTVSYTPTTSSNWAGTAPTTIQAAIDRLAAVVKSLNGGTGA